MENVNRWYFTKDQLADTPSRKQDIDEAKELSYRQQAANFIQDMGQRLQVSQLCINTAIVYMHRFYVFHSFKDIHRNNVSVSALFLAAKVEEQPRKLEHVIKVAHGCLYKDAPPLDVKTEAYADRAFEVVAHENILLQTLGFVLAIEHPHTYVVKVCQLVKASKDLAQTSYIMATTSLHMTTMCLQYKPTVVACVCIHLACKWSSYKIEPCSEGRDWFYYVDRSVTWDLLEKLTQEFIAILETSPHRFKRKYCSKEGNYAACPKSIMDEYQEKLSSTENKMGLAKKNTSASPRPSTSLSFDLCPDFMDKNTDYQSPEKPSLPSKSTSSEASVSQVTSTVTAKSQTPPLPTSTSSIPSSVPNKKVPKTELTNSISLAAYRMKIREKELLEPPTSVSDEQDKPRRLHRELAVTSYPHEPVKDKISMGGPVPNKVNHHAPKVKPEDTTKPVPMAPHRPVHAPEDAVVVMKRVSRERLSAENVISQFEDKLNEDLVTKEPPSLGSSLQKTKSHKQPQLNSTSHIVQNHHPVAAVKEEVPPPKQPFPVKTNGSKELDNGERKPNIMENNSKPEQVHVHKKDSSSKHERREKHKSKHNRKDREKSSSNHSAEQSQDLGIKVKIRKDILNRNYSPGDPSKQPTVKPDSPKKLKIKPLKPPPPPSEAESAVLPTPSLKLVLTKDKSGSGSYRTSHKHDRESRKRSHDSAPHKNSATEAPSSKYAKVEHSHKSAASGHKPRPPDYDGYNSHYEAHKLKKYPTMAPPPMPPARMAIVGATNSNPPLPPPLPPLQPPRPPPPPPE